MDQVRRELAKYLQSDEFSRIFDKLHPSPVAVALGVGIYAITIVRLPSAIRILRAALKRGVGTGKRRSEYERLAELGIPIRVQLVMENTELSRNRNVIAPALVVGCFEDPLATGGRVDLVDLAGLIAEVMMFDDHETELDARLARIMRDEEYRDRRRRPIPEEITNGRTVYAFDMLVVGPFLPDLWSPMRDRSLLCIAAPGPKGCIFMLPAHIAQLVE